jgi:hypothetical protein
MRRSHSRRDVIVAAAPWELRAFFVPAVMCPVWSLGAATHNAQIAQVATMSSWLLLGVRFFMPGSKLNQASCCENEI